MVAGSIIQSAQTMESFRVGQLLNVPPAASPDPAGPVLLLQERLSRGELTPEQYEQHRRLLVDGR